MNTRIIVVFAVIAIGGLIFTISSFGLNVDSEQKFSLTSASIVNLDPARFPFSFSNNIPCTFQSTLVSQTSEGIDVKISQNTQSLALIDIKTNEEIKKLKLKFQDKCDVDKNTKITLDSVQINVLVFADNKRCFWFNWCYTFIERIILYSERNDSEVIKKRIMNKFTPIRDSITFDVGEFDRILSLRQFTHLTEIVFIPYGYLKYIVDGEESIIRIDPRESKVSLIIGVSFDPRSTT